jgi:HEAT repeat protein
VTEAASGVELNEESPTEPAQEETAEPTAIVVPTWLREAPLEGAFAGLVRIDLPEDARPWRGGYDEQALRRRAQYSAGVERIASNFGALEPVVWDGDALLLVFGRVAASELPGHTFEAAKDLWNRVRGELDLPAKIAAHVGRVRPGAEPGLVTGRDVDTCRKLASEAAVGSIALSEELALALLTLDKGKREFTELANGPGAERFAYVFPPSAAVATNLVVDPTARLWDRLRGYALGTDVRMVRYVGFRLQKKVPPRLDIRDVFVLSEVELRRRSEMDLRKEKALEEALMPLPWSARSIAGNEEGTRDFRELFARHRSLVVLGDPGSGKTTLLRWLAVIAASGRFELDAQLGTAERLLPLPVSVGRLAEVRRGLGGQPVSVLAALARYFHDRNVDEDPGKLRDLLAAELERGHCLVLLDGLDEVKSDERQAIYQWLESFAGAYAQNRFIVSSRVVGYTGFQLPGDVAEAVLRPFTGEQVERYVRVFHRAYVKWETDAEPTDDGEANRLLESLRASSRLSGLARNPFMLSALALIHRAEGKLPRHRVQAYEVFARALCETWAEARRLVADKVNPPIIAYEEEALPILGELALAMHEQYPTGVAPEEFVLRKVAEALTQQKGVSGKDAKLAARGFLKRAGEDVQILLERGAGEWGFLHLTFQEFFVAAGLHAKEEFESVALQHLFDPRWEEVIRLGVGYMALVQKRPRAAQLFVKKVLEHEEPEPRAWFTKVLKKQVPLAALLAAEAGDALPEALQQRAAEEMADWVAVMPRDIVAPVLKELALTDFALRVALACIPRFGSATAETRARAAAALGDLRATGVEQALVAALSDESSAMRTAAATSLHSFLSDEVLNTIAQMLCDPQPEVRASAITALSPRGIDLSKTQLKSALLDTDEQVRAATAKLLRYLPHADARKAARRLRQDESIAVQAELVATFTAFTDTDWLKTLLRSNHEKIQVYAAMSIGVIWQSTPGFFDAIDNNLVAVVKKLMTPLWQSRTEQMASLHSQDQFERAGAVGALSGDESAIDRLLDLTNDPSRLVRARVITVLGRLSSERAIDACRTALGDTDIRVITAAAVALAHHKRDEAQSPLLDIFLHDPTERRAEAAKALGELRAKDALEPLMSGAREPQDKHLEAICTALGQLASSREADRLASYLEAQQQPSEYSDHIFTALWAIATRESRGPADPSA